MTIETMLDAQEAAERFMQQEVESIEVRLATTDKHITHHQGRDDFYEGIDSYRDVLIDDFRVEDYSNITEDLDKYLRCNNIDIDKETVLYKVLSRKFLLAKIDALQAGMQLCEGGNYEYLRVVDSTNLNVSINDFDQSSKSAYTNIIKWKNETQIRRQDYVNTEAKKIMTSHPNKQKQVLASEIVQKLAIYPLKVVSDATILKDYLGLYPNF
jgi:hypothetical protein